MWRSLRVGWWRVCWLVRLGRLAYWLVVDVWRFVWLTLGTAAWGCRDWREMSVRAGVPFRPGVPGCDYCYRLSRVLFRVAVVPHTGRAGDVCAACRVLIGSADDR